MDNKKHTITEGYFISYAQNYEDVYLRRIFSMIEKGFYIDAGAFDPELHSVTKNLYDDGWHGINIEPHKDFYEQFVLYRPRDINLNLAVSNKQDTMQMTSVMGVNSIDTNFIEKKLNHIPKKVEYTVKVETLNHILETQPIPKDIHLLKIDVEGHEQQVLEGINLKRHRPWLIMFEHPSFDDKLESLIQNPNFAIHNYLNEHNYQYAYHDGINFYYCADEWRVLSNCFVWPVNIMDQFLLHREVELHNTLQDIEAIMANNSGVDEVKKLIKNRIKQVRENHPMPHIFKPEKS